jgi:hypothetical protein
VWETVAGITRGLAADESMMRDVVTAIRAGVPEIAALDLDDVERHTRLFVGAGLNAVAERRGPTGDELRFVERLASTRASQGVPVTAMLASIYEGQQLVWRRASTLFAEAGVAPATMTEAFVAHLAWAQAVQVTAIGAHRGAELEAARRERDAHVELLHSLVTGPPLPHHRAELRRLGLADLERLWVLCADDELADAAPLSGRIGDHIVAIVAEPPGETDGVSVAVTGPVAVDSLAHAHELAQRVLAAAQRAGRAGIHTPADAAIDVAFGEHPELAGELARSWFAALDRRDRYARELVDTLLCYLDHGGRLEPTAAALYVHPNTIRYRLERLQALAGIELPERMDARVRLWWAARAWRDGDRR